MPDPGAGALRVQCCADPGSIPMAGADHLRGDRGDFSDQHPTRGFWRRWPGMALGEVLMPERDPLTAPGVPEPKVRDPGAVAAKIGIEKLGKAV